MNLRQFYEVLIAECAADAGGADLPKARNRALRAQQSWQTLLDRIIRDDSKDATGSS